jgi:hypothetical protein
MPIPVATRSKAWVCGGLLGGIAGWNPAGGFEPVVCCQVKVSASGQLLVQRSLTECGACECYRETSIMRRPWPTRERCALEKEKC